MSNSIVQEYDDTQATKLTELANKINKEVAEYGIVKPKGYSVSWHFNPDVELHHFGAQQPMKPWRLTLAKNLITAYGMHVAMDSYLAPRATMEDMSSFHSREYLDFLSKVTPQNVDTFEDVTKFGIGDDCVIFDEMWKYCSVHAGASIDAAHKIINNQSDIAINWSGGMHHALKGAASGFCYINDCVLAIIELLRYHPRVLYIDIDIHHGDGVEQAFWSTDRVMTVSFHKYDPYHYFPGTGPVDSNGPEDIRNPGSHHAVNVPLNDGIEDDDYVRLFKEIIGACVEHYRPTAVLLQCGADSLGADRLGRFNLSIPAHGACVQFVKDLNLPIVMVGGGGYTPRNVARCWAYETSVMIGADLHNDLPEHTQHIEAFGEDKILLPELRSRFKNKNSDKYLRGLVETIREQLRFVSHAPSVQMQELPPGILDIRRQVETDFDEELERENDEDRRRDVEMGNGFPGELAT